MLAFYVKKFGACSIQNSLNEWYHNYFLTLPSIIQERISGTSGRFVWIPDRTVANYSEEEILKDIRYRGPLFKKIMQELLEEAEGK